jgi:hypothetical protein
VKRKALQDLSIVQLVSTFEQIALAQDKALLMDEIAKYNRLYGEMDALKHELRNRTGDQRRALMSLYDHPNAQVRLKAAVATLAISYEPARKVLQAIVDSGEQPQALHAGMTLRNLDDGVFKPT